MDVLANYTEREIEGMTLLDMETLKRLNEVSAKVSEKYKIKSQALSICKMLEIVNNLIESKNEQGGERKEENS